MKCLVLQRCLINAPFIKKRESLLYQKEGMRGKRKKEKIKSEAHYQASSFNFSPAKMMFLINN